MNKMLEDPLRISDERINEAGSILNKQRNNLAIRFRALFLLRSVKNDLSVKWICKCFVDPSALLKHELAYCLGQMQNPTAIPCLIDVLRDEKQEPMVRHEAAEALGAIGDPMDNYGTYGILEKYSKETVPEVAETCQLALRRIQWLKEGKGDKITSSSLYDSIDPAPAADMENIDIKQLGEILIDKNQTLWARYKAMFALRNLNTDQATKALAQGLSCEESALFRHEIAYVLGQIQSPIVIPELKARLQMAKENGMVRHECAEALGSIGTAECRELLKQYLSDGERVVRESCEVALDIIDWNQDGKVSNEPDE